MTIENQYPTVLDFNEGYIWHHSPEYKADFPDLINWPSLKSPALCASLFLAVPPLRRIPTRPIRAWIQSGAYWKNLALEDHQAFQPLVCAYIHK